jgi:hypothetical protein
MDFPDRCVICGIASDVHVQVKFRIRPDLRKVDFIVGMCRHHADRQRIIARQYRYAFGLLALAPYMAALLQWLVKPRREWFDQTGMLWAGAFLTLFPGSLILAPYQPLYCKKSTASALWIGGAGEPFLKGLPPLDSEESGSVDAAARALGRSVRNSVLFWKRGRK